MPYPYAVSQTWLLWAVGSCCKSWPGQALSFLAIHHRFQHMLPRSWWHACKPSPRPDVVKHLPDVRASSQHRWSRVPRMRACPCRQRARICSVVCRRHWHGAGRWRARVHPRRNTGRTGWHWVWCYRPCLDRLGAHLTVGCRSAAPSVHAVVGAFQRASTTSVLKAPAREETSCPPGRPSWQRLQTRPEERV